MGEPDTITALMAGTGLSAACGFRVFLPFLGLSLAAMNGYVTLAEGFQWLGAMGATLVALMLPFAAVVIVIAILLGMAMRWLRLRRSRSMSRNNLY